MATAIGDRQEMKPVCIDLFCGLGGWTEGFLSEGYEVIGFDLERHDYGSGGYPGQLVLQDVLTIHGSQFRNAACIVASPPCTEYSYMAMPWTRAKQIEKALRGKGEFPEGYTGSRTVAQLNALFDACFRIQREACEASGRYIPMVVENVCGAQKWVGPAKARFGSFFFWGDVESVGGRVVAGGMRFGETIKPKRRGGAKVPGLNWSGSDQPGYVAQAFNGTAEQRLRDGDGLKLAGNNSPRLWAEREVQRLCDAGAKGYEGGLGRGHGRDPASKCNSQSSARKAASAQIAKVPFPLASYIARSFKP